MGAYGEWREVDSVCIHCIVALESRPAWGTQPTIIKGMEPMEYRHTEPHGCKRPEVYSDWNKREDWEKAKYLGRPDRKEHDEAICLDNINNRTQNKTV